MSAVPARQNSTGQIRRDLGLQTFVLSQRFRKSRKMYLTCVRVQKDQLNLQSVDIVSLRESLQVEQQRYRQLWDDRETVVTRLHSQIRQLQQGRDDYYTKNQELQVRAHTEV